MSPTQNLEDRINRFQYAQEFWHHDFITEGKDTLLGVEGNQGRLGLRQLSGTSLQMELQVMLQSLCEGLCWSSASPAPLGKALFALISRQGLAIKSFLTPLCTVLNNK